MRKMIVYYIICTVLLFIGITQSTNSILSFYNVKEDTAIYEKYLLDVKGNYQGHDFEEKISDKLVKLTNFLKSYDLVYYFAFLYSAALIGISLLLFKFIDSARIAVIYYSVISLFYTTFIAILQEINGNKITYLYQEMSKSIAGYSQNKYVAFQNIINNWHQLRVERFTANICIVTVLTAFYLFVIYFFSKMDIKILFKKGNRDGSIFQK